MLGIRDFVWSLALCGVLTFFFQCRPAWSAKQSVERDARDGFLEAYRGYREIDGDVITPPGQGAHLDTMAPPITRRSFQVVAEKLSWSGGKVELVARHVVELAIGPEEKIEVHVALEKRGSHWVYTLFEVRDGPTITDLEAGNPWIRALSKAPPVPPEQG